MMGQRYDIAVYNLRKLFDAVKSELQEDDRKQIAEDLYYLQCFSKIQIKQIIRGG